MLGKSALNIAPPLDSFLSGLLMYLWERLNDCSLVFKTFKYRQESRVFTYTHTHTLWWACYQGKMFVCCICSQLKTSFSVTLIIIIQLVLSPLCFQKLLRHFISFVYEDKNNISCCFSSIIINDSQNWYGI